MPPWLKNDLSFPEKRFGVQDQWQNSSSSISIIASRQSTENKIEDFDQTFEDEGIFDLKTSNLAARRSLLRPFMQRQNDRCEHWRLNTILVVAALIVTNLITAQSMRWRSAERTQSSDHCFFYSECHQTQQTPGHSVTDFEPAPVSDQLDLPLVTMQRDARLAPNASNPDHIYRLRPSPEVDKAWQRISYTNIYAISGEEVKRLGKDTSIAVPTLEEWHLGTTHPSYMMQIDVFHQLHCLNAI